jgi:protease I
MNPDKLRLDERVHALIRRFFENDMPVAVICHGPWTLINAGVVKGKRMTSYPSVRLDLENAGARWENAQVVIDGNLITSRNPHDLPAFENALLDMLESRSRRAASEPAQARPH